MRHSSVHLPRRRGAVIVLAAVALVALLMMVALSVDLGYLCTVRTELQCAADAGALAGIAELAEDPAKARKLAREYVKRNVAVKDRNVEVQFGRWDRSGGMFTPGASPRDALEVIVHRPDTPLFFGRLAGRSTQDMAGRAVASFSPRDIVLVLDFSGSMNSHDRVGELKKAVSLFTKTVEDVGADDRVAFTRYSTWGEMVIPLTDDLGAVEASVQQVLARGWTNIGHGMELARSEFQQRGRSHASKVMVVMTDGHVNRPKGSDPKTFVLDEGHRADEEGITVISISFGDDADKILMKQVADITGGIHFNVPDKVSSREGGLREVFRKIALKRPVNLVD